MGKQLTYVAVGYKRHSQVQANVHGRRVRLPAMRLRCIGVGSCDGERLHRSPTRSTASLGRNGRSLQCQ